MFCAGLEVELQAAALDQAQGDDDLLIGREIVARIVFLQRDGEDDLGTLDDLPQVAFEKLRLLISFVLPGSTVTSNRTFVGEK